jgi:hypothetical protein
VCPSPVLGASMTINEPMEIDMTDSKDIREVSFVSFNGPDGVENSYYLATSVKEIVMRRDGAGPMGWYDVVYVTTNEDRVSAIPAHNCFEIQFA